jgi:hypothetical protein
MKFAHALKEALDQGGYPANWVAAAVPYGQLKKCLKKVSLCFSIWSEFQIAKYVCPVLLG